MSKFWENIKNLFQSAEQSSSNQPVIHEVIERSEKEQADYEYWKETLVRRRLTDWLRGEHVNYLVDPKSTDPAIDFLNTPSSKGFVIHFYKTQYSNRDITHFSDFLKEKVLALDYKSYLSDTKTYNRKDWVERIDHHYLKPPTNLRQAGKQKMDQRFGNISIELLFRNDKAYLLKFRANSYHDHLYQEALQFDQLMKGLYQNS